MGGYGWKQTCMSRFFQQPLSSRHQPHHHIGPSYRDHAEPEPFRGGERRSLED
ncbi:hypothetical protein LZ32DRAFT_599507 [Colletotrichum eremochloae]|nr:hypothetical protein LZ32DRAFT_599507 [Colletotrichum eremochloae]